MSEIVIQSNFKISPPAARMLEWPEFLNYLSGFAASVPGQHKIQQMRPPDDLQVEIGLSHEALQIALKDQIPSLQTLEDCEELIHKSAIENQVMDGVQIIHIQRLVALNNEIRSSGQGWNREFPNLHSRMTHLPDLRSLEKEINSKLEPTGEL